MYLLCWPRAMLKGPKRSFVVVLIVVFVLVGSGESWAKNVPNGTKKIQNRTQNVCNKIDSYWTESREFKLTKSRKVRNKRRTAKSCYPKREGAVMPILFWDNNFLGCVFYFGLYGNRFASFKWRIKAIQYSTLCWKMHQFCGYTVNSTIYITWTRCSDFP